MDYLTGGSREGGGG